MPAPQPSAATAPAGAGPKSSAKKASSAAPVGVVSSPRSGPPSGTAEVGTPRSSAVTAGAGTGSTPCAVSTVPLPSAGGAATTRSGRRWCTRATALIRSTAVSMPPSSSRCSTPSPCTSRSAAAMRSASLATSSATTWSSFDAYIDTMSSSKVAKPGPSGTRKARAATPPRSTPRSDTSRLSMPAAASAGRTTWSSGPAWSALAPATPSNAATSMSPLMPLAQSRYRIIAVTLPLANGA